MRLLYRSPIADRRPRESRPRPEACIATPTSVNLYHRAFACCLIAFATMVIRSRNKRSDDWASARVREIFSIPGQRNGRETIQCNRCVEIDSEKDRSTDWRVFTSQITRAKVHIATSCSGIHPIQNDLDRKLSHELLLSLNESAMVNARGRDMC